MSIVVTGNEFVQFFFLCVFLTNFSSNGLFEGGGSSSSVHMKIFRSITKVCLKNQD